MKVQPNRLGIDRQHHLQGSAIDRDRPLQFRLDGITNEVFTLESKLKARDELNIEFRGMKIPLVLSKAAAAESSPLILRKYHISEKERL